TVEQHSPPIGRAASAPSRSPFGPDGDNCPDGDNSWSMKLDIAIIEGDNLLGTLWQFARATQPGSCSNDWRARRRRLVSKQKLVHQRRTPGRAKCLSAINCSPVASPPALVRTSPTRAVSSRILTRSWRPLIPARRGSSCCTRLQRRNVAPV